MLPDGATLDCNEERLRIQRKLLLECVHLKNSRTNLKGTVATIIKLASSSSALLVVIPFSVLPRDGGTNTEYKIFTTTTISKNFEALT